MESEAMADEEKWFQRTPKAEDVRAVLPRMEGEFTAEDVSLALDAPMRCNTRIGRILVRELAPRGEVRPVEPPRPNKATRYVRVASAAPTERGGE